jgi:hypothetical protein
MVEAMNLAARRPSQGSNKVGVGWLRARKRSTRIPRPDGLLRRCRCSCLGGSEWWNT